MLRKYAWVPPGVLDDGKSFCEIWGGDLGKGKSEKGEVGTRKQGEKNIR
jgi:hypothetical protein